ncbi:transcriptional regulator, Fis family [Mycobacterium xenopi 4042]|uniref:Transcriptional regulator, Fis family n=1 Tax=Mycobacterium xenopi 4042 TaxID=1299334 RepID=X8AG74_MYCXE|nr:transcriptional regulator, Fis family [Mycobacterium xenopi 4042]
MPRSAGHWLAVAESAVRGRCRSRWRARRRGPVVGRRAPAGTRRAIVVGGEANSSELLTGRDRVDGVDAAYVCRGRVCDLPVTTTEDLAAALAR